MEGDGCCEDDYEASSPVSFGSVYYDDDDDDFEDEDEDAVSYQQQRGQSNVACKPSVKSPAASSPSSHRAQKRLKRPRGQFRLPDSSSEDELSEEECDKIDDCGPADGNPGLAAASRRASRFRISSDVEFRRRGGGRGERRSPFYYRE